MYDLPGHAAPAVYRRAAFYLARASGYQPLDPGDPVIDRALDELATYPPERQIRLLTYASRRALPPGSSMLPLTPRPTHLKVIPA
jgi:hypothetical protein